MFNQKGIENGTKSLYHHNVIHGRNVLELVEFGIKFNILLETSIKDVLSNIIDVFHDESFLLSR